MKLKFPTIDWNIIHAVIISFAALLITFIIIFSTNSFSQNDDSFSRHAYSPIKRLFNFGSFIFENPDLLGKYDNGKGKIFMPKSFLVLDFLQMYYLMLLLSSFFEFMEKRLMIFLLGLVFFIFSPIISYFLGFVFSISYPLTLIVPPLAIAVLLIWIVFNWIWKCSPGFGGNWTLMIMLIASGFFCYLEFYFAQITSLFLFCIITGYLMVLMINGKIRIKRT